MSVLEKECECSDWKSKLVGLCADGAAVNLGVRSGAAKRLQEVVPHLVAIHCCAHRVELAMKGISTTINYFKTLEDSLVELYRLYHKSPLCWSELQQVGEMLQTKVLKPVKLIGTRWIGHRHRALKVLLDGWRGFVVHTSQVAQGTTKNKDRGRHLYTTLTSLKFFLFSRGCFEILSSIQQFSKVLQYDSITSDGMLRSLAATRERLGNVLSTVDSSLSSTVESLGENLLHQGETLKIPPGYADKMAVSTAVSQLLKKLVSEIDKGLDSRFSSFNSNPIIQAMSVFSPFCWPSDSAALAQFGYDKIRLLSSHFAQPLQHRGYSPESCIDEWPELKQRVREILSTEPTIKYLPMWQRVLHEYKEHPALPNVLALLQIVLSIPVQTSTLERGFSLTKQIKTDWRNKLSSQTLSELMMIKLDGPDLNHFDAEPAIMKWWRAGPRSRQLRMQEGPESDSYNSESDSVDDV